MGNKKRLLEIVANFKDTPITVLGDLMVDHYIWGQVNRISPEAPIVVVDATEESRRPGGAANVVSNLACLGAKTLICGVVGDDERGRLLSSLLEEVGADVRGISVDPSRATSVKTRVIARTQQVVRVDRESREPISGELENKLAKIFFKEANESRGVIISDYAKGVVTKKIFSQIQIGRDLGLFGLNQIPVIVDPKGPNFPIYDAATVVKPNRKEAEDASGIAISSRAKAIEAARILEKRWNTELMLITLGKDGMVIVPAEGQGEPTEIDTVAEEVFDISGAGDTVSAVFSLALAVRATPLEACILANYAAGVVVREIGAVPIKIEQLIAEIEKRG